MSIAVELAELAATAGPYGSAAFVLTTSADGRPHVSHMQVEVRGTEIVFDAGRGTRANAAARPDVVVLWPPHDAGGFSLIVDATARPDDGGPLVLEASHAVLHRPA